MRVRLEISDKALADVLGGAGSRYWCRELDWPDFEVRDGIGTCWEALLAGAVPFVTVVEDRSEEGEPSKRHRVTLPKIAKAIQLMLDANDEQIGDVLLGYESSGTDQWTGDQLLQFAVFGEAKYG